MKDLKTLTLIALMSILAYVGFSVKSQNGLIFREFAQYNTKVTFGDDGQFYGFWTSCQDLVDKRFLQWFRCSSDNREIPTLAIVGDSKASALAAGLFRTSLQGLRWMALSSRGGGDYVLLPVLSNAVVYSKYESQAPKAAIEVLERNQQITTVVIATSIRHLFQLKTDDSVSDLALSPFQGEAEQGLGNFIEALLRLNKKVIFLVDNPTLPHPEDCISRVSNIAIIDWLLSKKRNLKCVITYKEYLQSTKKYRAMITNLKIRFGDKLLIFETAPFLCDTSENGLCSMTKDNLPNGRPLYTISDHISDYAAGIIGHALNKFIVDHK